MAPTQARAGRALFVLTILTGSFLLFLVQPMVARMALPRLGGAPAVWNSAMLVYQALLLAGYAYAHALGRLPVRRQAIVHVAVLAIAAAWLPIGLSQRELPPDAQPALWVPWLLASSIGPLFFAVAAQAPLIQRWFARANEGQDPYPLYAASNAGSFGGLIAYPLLLEPASSLRTQSLVWTGGYLVLALLVVACGLRLPADSGRGASPLPGDGAPPATPARVLRWMVLAAIPSGLMLATSTYITTDIVAVPLLWVVPLGLYLLSFTVAFADGRDTADLVTRISPITVLLFGAVMMSGNGERPFFSAAIAIALLVVVSIALHTLLYRARPAPERLTGFYLAIAAGGVLGGLFAGLLAPVLFNGPYEYPLLILAAGLLVPQTFITPRLQAIWRRPGSRLAALGTVVVALVALFILPSWGWGGLPVGQQLGLIFVVIAAAGLFSIGERLPYLLVLATGLTMFGAYRWVLPSGSNEARTRSYFGIYTVTQEPERRTLAHGTTIHGVELTGSAARERTPTTYYAAGSGVGQAMAAAPGLYGPAARIGVVGLGAGTLACYARPGQHWRFYEIDPAVVRIARDTGQFDFLRRCLPDTTIVVGDARLNLAHEPTASLDLIVLDAFSSDAVPMHLLTREAFQTYARVVAPRGLLLVHISNRFLDLQPVVAAAAAQGGWQAMTLFFHPASNDRTASASQWIALSRDPRTMAVLAARDPAWESIGPEPRVRAWTDDHASILPLVKGWR